MTIGKGNLTRGVEITTDACRVLVEIPTNYNDLELAHNGFVFVIQANFTLLIVFSLKNKR